jgi:glycosyltransferase involved in cell wall biosynthesis
MDSSDLPVGPLLIRYVSHGYPTGYGEVGRRLINALIDQGVSVHWVPIQFDADAPLLPDRFVSEMPELEPLRATQGTPDVVVVHSVPEVIPYMAHLLPPGVPLVSHTVWEAPELQSHWPMLLNRCAGVVVPTRWNADAFVNGGVTVPVAVVPHATGLAAPGAADDEWLGPGGLDVGDAFVVHSIASWTARKAPWFTVEAYAKAFGPGDGTMLILKTDGRLAPDVAGYPGPEQHRRLTSWSVATILHRNRPTGRVHIEHASRTHAELTALHQRSDCWLSLPYSEGWNLGAFDAAAAGTPVITTRSGGPDSYLSPELSHLVPGIPMAAPNLEGVTWIDPDLPAAVEALRRVREDPQGARLAARAQGETIRKTYAPETVARAFLESLALMGVD